MATRKVKRRYGIPRRSPFTEVVCFNVTPEMKDELDKIADNNDCTVSYALRYACKLLARECKRMQRETIEEVEEDE